MFALTTSHRFELYSHPTDMRKSFNGLCGLIQNQMDELPQDGRVYIFINKRKDKAKLMHWSSGGFVLYYKRLESGTFELPSYDSDVQSLRLSYTQLVMLIDGISISNIHRRKRYKPTIHGG